jgi:leucyl-tRNA synthetase
MGGSFRFLQRIWTLVQEFKDHVGEQTVSNQQLMQVAHRTIKKVGQDLEALSFNTAIAAMMEEVNELYKIKNQDRFANRNEWQFTLESLLQLLAPFAPYIAEELWQQLGHDSSIHTSQWPTYDEKYLVSDKMVIAIQVNGKLRGEVAMPTDADEAAVIAAARDNNKVKAHTDGKEIVKTIYIPGKILNIVVK